MSPAVKFLQEIGYGLEAAKKQLESNSFQSILRVDKEKAVQSLRTASESTAPYYEMLIKKIDGALINLNAFGKDFMEDRAGMIVKHKSPPVKIPRARPPLVVLESRGGYMDSRLVDMFNKEIRKNEAFNIQRKALSAGADLISDQVSKHIASGGKVHEIAEPITSVASRVGKSAINTIKKRVSSMPKLDPVDKTIIGLSTASTVSSAASRSIRERKRKELSDKRKKEKEGGQGGSRDGDGDGILNESLWNVIDDKFNALPDSVQLPVFLTGAATVTAISAFLLGHGISLAENSLIALKNWYLLHRYADREELLEKAREYKRKEAERFKKDTDRALKGLK